MKIVFGELFSRILSEPKKRKWTQYVLLIPFISCILTIVYLEISYSEQMPRTVQEDSDRIHPVEVNHGVKVYVTRDEEERLYNARKYGFFVAGISVLLLFGIQKRYEDFRTSSDRLSQGKYRFGSGKSQPPDP